MGNVLLKDILTTDGIIPKGSKLLHPLNDMGPGGQVSIGHHQVAADFLSAAKKVKHPFTAFVSPDDRCARAIFALLTEGAETITNPPSRGGLVERTNFDHKEDSRLKSSHPDVQKVIGPDGFARKSVLLLHDIMKKVGFRGADAVTAIHEEGVLLFGPCPEFHCFPRRGRRAQKDIKELRRSAPWVQAKVSGATRGSSDASVDEALFDKSVLQVSFGLTRGPFTLSEAREKFRRDFVPCRRFPVVQKEKVRPVNDFSEFGHNTTSSNIEAVDMGGVDAVADLAKTWGSSVKLGGLAEVELENGSILKGSLHPSWTEATLEGRLLDLEMEFKQLPRDPSQADLAIMALLDPSTGEVVYFEASGLPFGARNSVSTASLLVPVTHCADDNTQRSKRLLTQRELVDPSLVQSCRMEVQGRG